MMIESMGISTSLIDEGTGPTLIFLHGVPDDKDEWRAVIDLLGAEYRSIAPDLPGFGASSSLPATYDFSLAAQVKFFDAFVNQVTDDEKITLVLHDVGAMMGLAWAAAHPERVARIIVMNVVFHTDYRWHSFARTMASPLWSKLFMRFVTRRLFVASFRRDFPLVRQEQAQRIYDGMSHMTRVSLPKLFRKMTAPDFFQGWETRLEHITRQIPTLVLWGKLDPMIPLDYAYRIGDNVRLLEDCGHWVPLVKPEIVAEEIRRFHIDPMAESMAES